jgi:acyl-CoA synthetase (NDP forming)
VVGESGAFKALVLDLAEELGLPLARLEAANAPELRAALPPFVPVGNPLDITAQGLSQPSIYTDVLNLLLGDHRVGGVVAGIIQTDPVTTGIKVPAILAALEGRRLAKPMIFAGLDEGADIPGEHIAALRGSGVPWFPTTERAFRALTRLGAMANRDLTNRSPAPKAIPGLTGLSGTVPEHAAKRLLAPLGIRFPEGRFAATVSEACAAAQAMGFPVAMKAQAAALGHKSDAGGVVLGLADADAVRGAWERIHANVASYDSAIVLEGVLVERMSAQGIEMIVGGRNDPDWGPVVLAGFGGVAAEVLQDVRLITPDLGEEAIAGELMRLKSAPLLGGYRGSPPLDVPALARLITDVSAIFLAEPSLVELDLNPVIVRPLGQGAVALDALMVVRGPLGTDR